MSAADSVFRLSGRLRYRPIALAGIFVALILSCCTALAGESYLRIEIDSRDELKTLTETLSIDNVDGLHVFAYASDEQLVKLESLGYVYTVLTNPSALIAPRMAASLEDVRSWDNYPTYEDYVNMMYQFESDYPLICDVQTIGYSVEGREIIFAKISDDVYSEEDEAEVMYTSTMHGSELCGYVLLLRLVDSLLVSYGSDPRITDMIDNMEIWINPLANPDGTYAGGNHTVEGATRWNANGADLNRNYPDPEDGPHPDGKAWQPETVAMMDLAEENRFVISANFHDGAELLNYPWDTWSNIHADDGWFQIVCHKYADTAHSYSPDGYLEDFDNGVVRGWEWYTINGGRQDYMTYFRGGREVTIELTHSVPLPDELPLYWDYNRVSLIDYIENARLGIRGGVTELGTGEPVIASVSILNHDVDSARVFTDPDVGDYHRMIESGIYNLEFSAFGYLTDTIEGVTVSDGYVTYVDVEMELVYNGPILEFDRYQADLITPGDTVLAFLTLTNTGGSDAFDVTGTLFSDDGYVTVPQGYSTFPDIPRLLGHGTSETPFQLVISPSCPVLYLAEIALGVEASGGYADTLTFGLLIGRQIEGFESGTFESYPWETGVMEPWLVVESEDAFEGDYLARSWFIDNGQSSSLQLTLDVLFPGTITFYFTVSSQVSHDFLRFFIDGTQQCRWSGEVPWEEASFPVDSGLHTFEWQYRKDISGSEGLDACMIDYVIFPISVVALHITSEEVPDWTLGVPMSSQLEASGGVGQYSWIDAYGDLDGTGLSLTTAGLVSGVPGVVGQTSFTARVNDEVGTFEYSAFTFNVNPEPIITTSSLPAGFVGAAYSQQLEVTGGTGQKIWSDRDGDLVGTGLDLSEAGILSGMPTSVGSISFVARAEDEVGAVAEASLHVDVDSGWVCGDADGSEEIDIDDAVYLIAYIFSAGPPPSPIESGDADCSGGVDIDDAVRLIVYIFSGGFAPCDTDGDGTQDC